MSEEKLYATCSHAVGDLGEFDESLLSKETWAAKPRTDTCFESRKKRPPEKGRKKRKKGKWNPTDLLSNITLARNSNSGNPHNN